jgi:hypothetical protein
MRGGRYLPHWHQRASRSRLSLEIEGGRGVKPASKRLSDFVHKDSSDVLRLQHKHTHTHTHTHVYILISSTRFPALYCDDRCPASRSGRASDTIDGCHWPRAHRPWETRTAHHGPVEIAARCRQLLTHFPPGKSCVSLRNFRSALHAGTQGLRGARHRTPPVPHHVGIPGAATGTSRRQHCPAPCRERRARP